MVFYLIIYTYYFFPQLFSLLKSLKVLLTRAFRPRTGLLPLLVSVAEKVRILSIYIILYPFPPSPFLSLSLFLSFSLSLSGGGKPTTAQGQGPKIAEVEAAMAEAAKLAEKALC